MNRQGNWICILWFGVGILALLVIQLEYVGSSLVDFWTFLLPSPIEVCIL